MGSPMLSRTPVVPRPAPLFRKCITIIIMIKGHSLRKECMLACLHPATNTRTLKPHHPMCGHGRRHHAWPCAWMHHASLSSPQPCHGIPINPSPHNHATGSPPPPHTTMPRDPHPPHSHNHAMGFPPPTHKPCHRIPITPCPSPSLAPTLMHPASPPTFQGVPTTAPANWPALLCLPAPPRGAAFATASVPH